MMTATHPDFTRALMAAKDGDSDAFADLWRIANPRLLRYLKVMAPELAGDVASATWATIGRTLDGFPADEVAFRKLMIRIARDETAARRRVGGRRPDAIIDLVRAEAAGRAAGESGAAEPLPTAAAVRLVGRLPGDVAEMVALRVIVGLDAEATAELVGLRPGGVRVAVQRGLRRTADLLGEADVFAAPVDPWALDRLVDEDPARLVQLDGALGRVVSALAAPGGSPGNLSGLEAGQRAFRQSSRRSYAVGALALLPLLAGRRLAALRTMLTGKVAAVAVGTVVLSAPAAVAYSDPIAAHSGRPAVTSSAQAGAGPTVPSRAALTPLTPLTPLIGPATARPSLAPAPVRAAPPPAASRSRVTRTPAPPQPTKAERAQAKPSRQRAAAQPSHHATARPQHRSHRVTAKPPAHGRDRHRHGLLWWLLHHHRHRHLG